MFDEAHSSVNDNEEHDHHASPNSAAGCPCFSNMGRKAAFLLGWEGGDIAGFLLLRKKCNV